ncbi:hypothetical protein C1645_819271 [Glomus cerebriforme]|uniref:Uncharacterized protein n=1 Tax=Glomus cerebriforme TaxID=658196 RepID=A0A397T5H0_9GLOM|nr:hypothetical protein C1645_819271 [Glomus cerebriforme]
MTSRRNTKKQATSSNVTAKQGRKRKVPGDGVNDTDVDNIVFLVLSLTNPSELLEISDNNLLPDESQISSDDDDAVKFKHNPLALITNNKKGNVIRNNILADLNKASGRNFDNDFYVNNSNSSYLHSPNITHIDNPPYSSITPINYNNLRSNINNLPRSSITPINYNNLHSNIDNSSRSSITPSINYNNSCSNIDINNPRRSDTYNSSRLNNISL